MRPGLRSVTTGLARPPDLLSTAPTGGQVIWLTEGTSLVASGPFLDLEAGRGPDRFHRASALFQDLMAGARIDDAVDVPGTGPVVFGSWTFDPRTAGSRLLIPSVIHGLGEGGAWRTEIDFNGIASCRAPRCDSAGGSDATDDQWVDMVGRALSAIAARRLEKVVLARQVTFAGQAELQEGEIAGRLRRSYPGCFVFCFDQLVGASPELLIRRVGDVVDSLPLAGSAPRGATPNQDLALGRSLQQSQKNLSEHALTVSSVVQALRPFCAELVAEPEPSLLLLANLQHLSTKVQGTLGTGADALQLVGALHPTAAVCGVPRKEALELIRGSESFSRGRYAGPIGWMDHHGDGEWALALRCALIQGSRARVFAGAGIVADSDPWEELEETRLKLQAMLAALHA